jgi:hypothetical protein
MVLGGFCKAFSEDGVHSIDQDLLAGCWEASFMQLATTACIRVIMR